MSENHAETLFNEYFDGMGMSGGEVSRILFEAISDSSRSTEHFEKYLNIHYPQNQQSKTQVIDVEMLVAWMGGQWETRFITVPMIGDSENFEVFEMRVKDAFQDQIQATVDTVALVAVYNIPIDEAYELDEQST